MEENREWSLMGFSTTFWVNVITAAFTVFLSVSVTAIGWYLRKYVISEVQKNTAFREYLLGTDLDRDEGLLQEMREMHQNIDEEHDEVRKRLEYLARYVRRIADSVEADIEEPYDPFDGDPDKWVDTQDD